MNLDPNQVPQELHILLPLVEKFAVSDDGARLDLLENATEEEKKQLASILNEYEDALDDWLGGPEAEGPEFSAEYIAFTQLRMAADEFEAM